MKNIILTYEQQNILNNSKINSRMLVSAPPGCGKTTLILYLLEQWQQNKEIKPYKSVLLMSFSNNASNKIKLELQEKAKESDNITSMLYFLKEKTVTTNYHGLCRRILFKQRKRLLNIIKTEFTLLPEDLEGITNSLNSIQKLQPIDLSKYTNYTINENNRYLSRIDGIVKRDPQVTDDIKPDDIKQYSKIMVRDFLSKGTISYNGILILTLYLLVSDTDLLNNYRSYFTHIIVDEFQDTNILSCTLLNMFIENEHTKFYGFGDELQQIYQFIGAIPHIFDACSNKWDAPIEKLTNNKRYENNKTLLAISRYIRDIAENQNPQAPIEKIELFTSYDKVIEYISSHYQQSNCCVLFQTRGLNHDGLISNLIQNKIPYFLAMFSEDSVTYREFHTKARIEWSKLSTDRPIISTINQLIKVMRKHQTSANQEDYESLMVLLEKLRDEFKINGCYQFLEDTIQFQIVTDILFNETLRQFIDRITDKVIISTIHAAKGLEWDYTVTIFTDWIIKKYKTINHLSLINVGLSRARLDAKICYVGNQSLEFYNTICNVSE